MRDRLSTKILSNGATRYGVYDETGALLRYEYIKLEDEPTVEGDLFSKANMLPDSIPAALGLKMGNPQVKDALNVLANIGNVHVWENKNLTDVPAHITENAVSNLEVFYATAGSVNPTNDRYSTTYYVADSITVNDSGDITLSNPTEVTCYIRDSTYSQYYNADALRGKYIKVKQTNNSYVYNRVLGSGVFKIAQNAVFSVSNPESYTGIVTVDKAYSCVGIPLSKTGTTTYLTSTDPNAYPKQSAEGGQDAYYTLGDVVIGSFVSGGQKDETYGTWSYGSELSVSSDGALSLSGTTGTVSTGYGSGSISSVITELSVLKGKFAQLTTNRSGLTIPTGVILFIPTDMTITNELYDDGVKNKVIFDKYQPVTGYPAIPANTTITYLGQLGDGARIEVGSYVGTGTTTGVTLTFESKPKIVIVKMTTYSYTLICIYEHTYGFTSQGTSSNVQVTTTWGNKSITFKNGSNSSTAFNDSGKIYEYIAIY